MRVKLVSRKGQAALVEYLEGGALRRCVVPLSLLSDDEVAPEALERGLPYGLPWEELLRLATTPEAVAQELRRRGIWTLADLRACPQAAVGALQSCYGVDRAALLRAAEHFDKERGA